VNQLRCRDLRAGDLLLKLNAGSAVNKVIALGQELAQQRNAQVVHAAVMVDGFYVVEASGGGIHGSDMRVQNKSFGYIVYRPTNDRIAKGAGECAKLMLDIQARHRNLAYSIPGAVGSLFPSHSRGPASRSSMDAAFDRIIEGKSHPFFCSHFVVHVYQFVAEQNGIPAASVFSLRDAKVSPSTLASMLQANANFDDAGYVMPNER